MALPLPKHSKPKKSVRFNQTVHVTPFERASMAEGMNIWYSILEVASMKAKGREMAASMRKLGPHQIDEDFYRGFEGYTLVRQRQRLLSIRCAIYAHKLGMDATMTAAMYKQCNQWSCDVAFVQAVHDTVYSHDDQDITSVGSIYNKLMMDAMPTVATMVPPPDLPFAVQGFVVLHSQRKTKLERKLKRRSAMAGIRRVRHRIC
jgi:hypothetical protein